MSVNYEVLNKFLDADTLELEYHRVTNNIKELEDNPKIITKFEPLIWLAFIALTAVVGCPIF